MINTDMALKVMRRCVDDSCNFWMLGDNWKISYKLVTTEAGAPANCARLVAYLKAYIDLDPAQCETLEEVWEHTAHEMAHVALAEFDIYIHTVDKVLKQDSVREFAFEVGSERCVTLLERVFLRERPYPGDDAFAETAAT